MPESVPKYALFERERRFLVDPDLLPELANCPATEIVDQYIEGTHLRLRAMRDLATGSRTFKLGKKYPSADRCARPIVNVYLDEPEHGMLAALPSRRLTKTRFKLVQSGAVFCIDRHDNPRAGLWLAEIEALDELALRDIAIPAWAVREVTRDPTFDGWALAE